MVLLLGRVIHGSSLTGYAFCIIAFWKGNTLRLAPDKRKLSVNILVWLLNLKVIDMGLRKMWERWALARLLTKLVSCQSKPAKQIYNIMQPVHARSAAGNFSLLLLRCTFFPRELISEYTTDWLEPELFPMWDGKPISRSNSKSLYCMRLQYLLLGTSVYCSLRRCAGRPIVLQLWFLLFNQISLIFSKWNGCVVESQHNWKMGSEVMQMLAKYRQRGRESRTQRTWIM